MINQRILHRAYALGFKFPSSDLTPEQTILSYMTKYDMSVDDAELYYEEMLKDELERFFFERQKNNVKVLKPKKGKK